MFSKARCLFPAALLVLGTSALFGQTSAIEGDVKGPDGKPVRDAQIKIERTDIKGNYKVKTDRKGHYLHVGLPLGTYNVTLEMDGQVVDSVKGVKTRLGDPTPINFDLAERAQKQAEMQKAAETGTLTAEQARDMTPEQKAALEKQMKEKQAALAKNKELNDAFNQGMEALKTKQYDVAVQAFTKASTMDPKQHVVWAQLGDAQAALAASKTGAEQQAATDQALQSYAKAIELNPSDASYHNNYGLALARAKKIPEAQAELEKAVQLDPPGAGRYYYNLGAVLVNTGQIEPAGEAFKKAIAADPNYADAQYQYGVYLVSKATTTPDGKIVPPPGTKEAFQKYLELRPDGPNAEGAKAMLTSMEATVETEYKNPAKKGGKKK